VRKIRFIATALAVALAGVSFDSRASLVYYDLSTGNFSQDWTNTGLITTNNDWSGVPSIQGFGGDNALATGTNPGLFVTPLTTLNVLANQTNPNTTSNGAVGEFAIANPTIAVQGSGSVDAPSLVLYMNSVGRTNIQISYTLRDIDGSSDNSTQPIALQYRASNTGNFINVPAGFVADASTGPSLATATTAVSATLPAWDNLPMLEFRILTTDAVGSDEWIGIDNILVSSAAVPEASAFLFGGLICGAAAVWKWRRRDALTGP
jgi:hypothetical protein